MIDLLISAFLGVVLGASIMATFPREGSPRWYEQNKELIPRTAATNHSWRVYVEPTDDPARYRGVYEQNGRRKYTAEASGITNTLEALVEEIRKW